MSVTNFVSLTRKPMIIPTITYEGNSKNKVSKEGASNLHNSKAVQILYPFSCYVDKDTSPTLFPENNIELVEIDRKIYMKPVIEEFTLILKDKKTKKKIEKTFEKEMTFDIYVPYKKVDRKIFTRVYSYETLINVILKAIKIKFCNEIISEKKLSSLESLSEEDLAIVEAKTKILIKESDAFEIQYNENPLPIEFEKLFDTTKGPHDLAKVKFYKFDLKDQDMKRTVEDIRSKIKEKESQAISVVENTINNKDDKVK